MHLEAAPARNWFDQGGQAYARFRPEYPLELARFLALAAPGRLLAVDVGCGSGQLTTQLAAHFDSVLGVDPSGDQILNAAVHARVQYVRASAEQLPVADHSAQLITAAQAAHWFDLPRFYDEVRRIAGSGAVLALISYGVPRLDAQLDRRFSTFYWQEIGPFWPVQRRLVDDGYVDLPFPFSALAAPTLVLHKAWRLADLLGYIATWSAVRRAHEAGCEAILQGFASDLAALWGDPMGTRAIRWPIHMRLGAL